MVTSAFVFNRLIAIDTLLQLDAVIPSLSDLQSQLIDYLHTFTRALADEGIPAEEAKTLSRLVCIWLDSTIERQLTRSWLTWKHYALEPWFFSDRCDTEAQLAALAQLFDSPHDTMRNYASGMLLLLSAACAQKSAFETLLATHSLRNAVPAPQRALLSETVQTEMLSSRIPLSAHVIIDFTLLTGLLATLWVCCSHSLEALYQCLF